MRTYNEESDWSADPKNYTEEAYQEFKKVAIDLAKFAYDHDAVFLVENYVNNIVGSVDQVARLLQEVNHPGLGLLCDPTNYFDGSNIDDVDPTIEKIFHVLMIKSKLHMQRTVSGRPEESLRWFSRTQQFPWRWCESCRAFLEF